MSLDRFPKKPCKFCGSNGHFPYMCYKNPKNKKNRYKSIKGKGKYGKQWDLTRDTWFRNNPPDKHGLYECYLKIHPWCPIRMIKEKTTLDHVIARSKAPSLRFVAANLKPACYYCNGEKGSRTLEQVRG